MVGIAAARLWESFGLKLEFAAGKKSGIFTAAFLAGILSLRDTLKILSTPDDKLKETIRTLSFKPAAIPILSNATGTWMTQAEIDNPEYWVRYRDDAGLAEQGLKQIQQDPERYTAAAGNCSSRTALLGSIGSFWLKGGNIDWNKLYPGEKRHRIPLPTYPFERKRFWIEPAKVNQTAVLSGIPETQALVKQPRPDLSSAYAEPENETQRSIVKAWQDVLGFDRIGINDDFYELGGHSLLAAAIANSLRTVFNMELPLDQFLQHSTVKEVSAMVETYLWAANEKRDVESTYEQGTI